MTVLQRSINVVQVHFPTVASFLHLLLRSNGFTSAAILLIEVVLFLKGDASSSKFDAQNWGQVGDSVE